VTAAIAHEIGITLNARDQERVFRRQRVDVGAYDAYLKGRHQYFTGFTEDSTNRAIAYFQQALAIDPNYAPAYAGLADCYFGMSNIYKAPTEVMPKAQWAARKALDLDDALGDAYASLALVQSVFGFNREAAERGFRRALELQPSNAEAHLWYSQHLAGLGRFDEAVSQLGQAEKLDPASPAVSAYAGLILFLARRNDEIIERLRPISDLHPDYHHPYAWLGLAYEQRRQWPQAIAAMGKAYALDGEPEALAQLGHIYACAGKKADALKVLGKLRQLSRRRYVSAYNFAVLYAGLGQTDDAFEWLQKVEQDRSEWFAAVNVDPRLDVLHSDPRFAAVLRSVGLGH
jgi:serine/threonine-protein kinase